ncbi:MAG: hypothetical protein WCT54_00340 [Patescibacteria group bacterium]
MYKKLFMAAALLLGLSMSASTALAADFKSGQMVNVAASDNLSGDLYAAGNDVSVDTNVPGDAFLAGAIIRVSGDVASSLHAAGSVINVNGKVGHALRVAGSQVMIGGTIEGDVVAGGAMVYILPGTVIKGDLYLGAGSAVIDGTVMGNVKSGGGDVTLRGDVAKNVFIQADRLSIGDQAKVTGMLAYESPEQAEIPANASIGAVEFKQVEKVGKQPSNKPMPTAGKVFLTGLIWLLAMIVVSLIVTFVGWYFFKQRMSDITTNVLNNFAPQMGWGFVWLVVTPIACIVLLVTLVGIPISVLIALTYGLAVGVANIMAGVIVGAWLMKLINKKRGWMVDWKAIVLGVVAISLVMLIPILGWIACFVFFLAALGGTVSAMRGIAK